MRQFSLYVRFSASQSSRLFAPTFLHGGEQFDKKLMRKRVNIVVLLGLFLSVSLGVYLSAISSATHEVSVSCMMVYDEGGAPAVLKSPECPQWGLSYQSQHQILNCQFATLQGYREYQEDRITCNLEMNIPFIGNNGTKEVLVGVAAVFDGHGGKEASEMASKKLLDYFILHVVFNTYKQAITCKEHDLVFQGHNKYFLDEGLPVSCDDAIHEILKKALLRTIHDIDIEFSQKAFKKRDVSGSTATVVLLVDGQILVASVGDSKALLCSEDIKPAFGDEGTSVPVLDVEELTRDHHPDRDDERARIEAAGGFVRTLGVPRVNGLLAVSRSIGDVYLKRYGLISVPEVIGWRNITANDSYLVVASDGIFESLTTQNVCDLLRNANTCSSSSSLADCIVNIAFERGSGDNLSAVVVPLNSTGISD